MSKVCFPFKITIQADAKLCSSAFYAIGIMAGTNNPTMFYYVVANAFLKLFIVVLYMSQSFYGLQNGSHEYP